MTVARSRKLFSQLHYCPNMWICFKQNCLHNYLLAVNVSLIFWNFHWNCRYIGKSCSLLLQEFKSLDGTDLPRCDYAANLNKLGCTTKMNYQSKAIVIKICHILFASSILVDFCNSHLFVWCVIEDWKN